MKAEPQVPRALTEPGSRKPYKSPQRKLVQFFERSRNQWKGKCLEAKAALKQLKKKLQRMEERQQRRKIRLQALQSDLARLQVEKRVREEVGEKKAR